MKKRLKVNAKTEKYILSLPNIYLIGCWAHCAAWSYPFSGKYSEDNIPLVWVFDDHNGAGPAEYVLSKITLATTGRVYGWDFNRAMAQSRADMLEYCLYARYEDFDKFVKERHEDEL